METSEWYLAFAEFEAAGSSPIYEGLATAVAESAQLVELLDAMPRRKRQPNLLLAAARLAGAPVDDPARFVEHVVGTWDEISSTMLERTTQTNEAARTATFLPILAQVAGPIALVEMGCSAGLCLYPDRYSISYDHRPPLQEDSPVLIDVSTSGPVPLPQRLPEVVARVGVDLHPIDVDHGDSRRWLETLVWPEHEHRLRRLRAAMEVARDDPPTMLKGDLIERIDDALALVPDAVTPVVFHSAVLYYLTADDRSKFTSRIGSRRDVVWISNEGPGVVDGLTTELRPPADARSAAFFIVARSGSEVIGISDPHGSWIRWPT